MLIYYTVYKQELVMRRPCQRQENQSLLWYQRGMQFQATQIILEAEVVVRGRLQVLILDPIQRELVVQLWLSFRLLLVRAQTQNRRFQTHGLSRNVGMELVHLRRVTSQ